MEQSVWGSLKITVNGNSGQHAAECGGCGWWLWPGSQAYRIPGLRGTYCSVACVETALFGQEHCRWCGEEMAGRYMSIESRLCSEDCRTNFWAHVWGDRTAQCGSGKRLAVWLQRKEPRTYRQLVVADFQRVQITPTYLQSGAY